MSNTKLIRISSKDRVSGTNTNFVCSLGYEDLAVHRVRKATLVSCIFNNNEYNVNGNNNTLTYEINGAPLTLVVPEGQYSTSTLIAYIQAQQPLFTAITQDTTNYKLSFTTATTCQIFSSGLGEYIGFTEDSTTAITITADNIPNLNGLDAVLIKSDKLANGNMLDSKQNEDSVFAVVPVDVSFGLQNVYHDTGLSESSHTTFAPRNLSSIDIELTNQRGEPVDIQGEVVLVLKAYYD
jgi:hypothetical protein